MSNVALIRPDSNYTRITVLSEDGRNYHKVSEEKIPNRKMSDIKLLPVDRLTKREYKDFLKAIHTRQGKDLLQELRNSKTNDKINTFLKSEYIRISTAVNNKPKFMVDFIKELIDSELIEEESSSQYIITISKREIYDYFVKNKLITK